MWDVGQAVGRVDWDVGQSVGRVVWDVELKEELFGM